MKVLKAAGITLLLVTTTLRTTSCEPSNWTGKREAQWVLCLFFKKGGEKGGKRGYRILLERMFSLRSMQRPPYIASMGGRARRAWVQLRWKLTFKIEIEIDIDIEIEIDIEIKSEFGFELP
jgi:hypothetical protein